MLKIDRVEIHGFKSFCDRTEVHFRGGITAVVGPNGCGKSNIGDALHWVLGEQSARTLRGGKMEDVIFAGTEARGPHGMAEVSLHLQSSNGDLPAGEASAIVTRRLFRSGDGEYLINGRKVRLRDIQEMLHAARVGATTYAVIEQGKVDAILSAKPRDRRHLIEEAAGIIGYKQKRHLAELKLQATEANLLRIHDVILEVRRQIGSLKRQAARARRYSRIRDDLRAFEGRILAARARDLRGQEASARRDLEEAQAREAAAAAALAAVGSELEAARELRRDMESRLSDAREDLHTTSRAIDGEERTIRGESERADELRREAARLEAEGGEIAAQIEREQQERAARDASLASLDAELGGLDGALEILGEEESGLRSRLAVLESAIEGQRAGHVEGAARLAERANTVVHLHREIQRLAAQSARLASEAEEATREGASIDLRLRDARSAAEIAQSDAERARGAASESERARLDLDERLEGLVDSISARRETLARLDERVRSLEDVEARLAGVGAGARWLLTRKDGTAGSVRGVVADYLQVGPDAEAAVEAYLGSRLGAVVVPSSESAVSFVGELEATRSGRCLFVPEGVPQEIDETASLAPDLAREPGVLGALSERTSTTNGIQGIVARMLSGAVLARDLRTAIDLARRFPGHDYVTPAGDVVAREGTIEGGRGEGVADGPLTRRRLLEATRRERHEEASRLEIDEDARRVLSVEREELAHRLAEHERAYQEAQRAAALCQERGVSLGAEQERAARRRQLLATEMAALESERSEAAAHLASSESERKSFEADLVVVMESMDARLEEMDRLRLEAAASGERLAEQRQARAAVRERRRHMVGEISRMAGEIADLDERLRRGVERKAEASRRAEEAARAAGESQLRLASLLARHASRIESVSTIEAALRAADESTVDLEERERRERASMESIREGLRSAELASTVAVSDLRHLDERCRTSLDEGVDSLLARVPEEPGVDGGALEAESAQLRSKLEAMGPVNLLAIEEFRGLEERYAFFQAQETDLTASMESLKDTIRRINRTSRERFLEAFERVRAHFNETFRLLFGGGRADIRLMEDEDPLECGLEISVQPPGKKLQSLSLLSGGEKAMSAIALLFAIFRFQPSPFCLLDEVDAALDESNVRRFTRMLKEFSDGTQFIVITHNKRSMEAADALYGVTMEEPGISRIVSMSLA